MTLRPDGDLWIFGYGSLIWDPGFDPAERVLARLSGWRRSFCLSSWVHRGRPEAPGLVLALDADRAAVCDGVAFRAPKDQADGILEALRARELVTSAYLERWLPVDLADGRRLTAVTYVIDPAHEQYQGGLPLDDQARIIAQAVGGRGPNADYLYNTAAHLGDLGLADPQMDDLCARVRALRPA
ncbi:gamma-glutamylcyclotransferase [Paracoccus sp. p3-h83]|uniref:gamma-glutamylcyclotransferase n=1 Tax=Paracoccus sp. p3-h83 TaxID=3342805 RepID=UPI0035B96000